jgi:hypothetical protein
LHQHLQSILTIIDKHTCFCDRISLAQAIPKTALGKSSAVAAAKWGSVGYRQEKHLLHM